MPFERLPGMKGRFYIPGKHSGPPPKHACSDCFACQACSHERCAVCRAGRAHATDGPPDEACPYRRPSPDDEPPGPP